MSLLKDAQKLVRAVRDDEQHRGFDYFFADMIEKLAYRVEQLEKGVEQLTAGDGK